MAEKVEKSKNIYLNFVDGENLDFVVDMEFPVGLNKSSMEIHLLNYLLLNTMREILDAVKENIIYEKRTDGQESLIRASVGLSVFKPEHKHFITNVLTGDTMKKTEEF